MSQEQTDRKDLKVQALLEKVGGLTARYENEVADLRVELTLVSQELENYRAREQETDVSGEKSSPATD